MKKLSTNFDYWNDLIKRYQIGKKLRLYKEKHNLSYSALSDLTGFKRQYIYGVEQITVKPNKEFIKKLERLENEIHSSTSM